MIPENLLFLASAVGLDIGLLSTHKVCWGCQGIIVIIQSMLQHFVSSLPLPAPLAQYHAQHQQCQQGSGTSDSMTDDSCWGLPMVELGCIALRIICHFKRNRFLSLHGTHTTWNHLKFKDYNHWCHTQQQAEVPPTAYLDFLEEEMVESSWPQWCYNFCQKFRNFSFATMVFPWSWMVFT